MSADTLTTCLNLSGTFEGGQGARYTLTTGNSDDQGISCGALQFCAGQGSLQELLRRTLGGYPVANDQFAPLFALKDLSAPDAVAYAIAHWVDPTSPRKALTREAKALWETLLAAPQCIQAQRSLAQEILTSALTEAAKFLPWRSDAMTHLRLAAFFFDVHTQQGSLSKHLPDGTHKPDVLAGPYQASPGRAVNYARQQGHTRVADAWNTALASGDELCRVLLHYAYERAALAKPQYMWDTLSRRGTIAARQGQVHGAWFDLTKTLP